jgi:hypothetical protein
VGGDTKRNIEDEEETDGVRRLWETCPKMNCFVNGNMKPLISQEFHASAILAEIYICGTMRKIFKQLWKHKPMLQSSL